MDTKSWLKFVSNMYVVSWWIYNTLAVLFGLGAICRLFHVRLPDIVEAVYLSWTSADTFIVLLIVCLGLSVQMHYVRTRIIEDEQEPDSTVAP